MKTELKDVIKDALFNRDEVKVAMKNKDFTVIHRVIKIEGDILYYKSNISVLGYEYYKLYSNPNTEILIYCD